MFCNGYQINSMKRQLRGRLSNRDKRPLIVSNMANKTKLELNSIEMIMYGVLKHQTQKFQLDERHSLSIDTRLESLAKVMWNSCEIGIGRPASLLTLIPWVVRKFKCMAKFMLGMDNMHTLQPQQKDFWTCNRRGPKIYPLSNVISQKMAATTTGISNSIQRTVKAGSEYPKMPKHPK